MKSITKLVMFLMMITMPVMANDIYVTQSGATSNFNIDQIGNSNVLTFDINGASYTGTFSTTGNSNNIDFNCDSGGTVSSCATVTASIIWVGSSNDLDIDVGETATLQVQI